MKDNNVKNSSISNLRINPKVNSNKHVTQFLFFDSFFPPKEMVARLGGNADLLRIPPQTLAEQLTLIDTEIYLQIEIRGIIIQLNKKISVTKLTNCAWRNNEHLHDKLLPDGVDNEGEEGNETSKGSSPTEGSSYTSTDSGLLTGRRDRSNSSSNELSSSSTVENGTIDNQLHESPLHQLEKATIDAPNLLYMIDHINRLSLWVATIILQQKTTTKQVEALKYFYLVAHRCLELNNFHGCAAIFGGTCLEPVQRLKPVQKIVATDQLLKRYSQKCMSIVNTEKNYQSYRTVLEQWFESDQISPCLPFVPVLVKDLFVIQTNLTVKNWETNEQEVDLKMLEKNCRLIRRFYETQQRSRLYGNSIVSDVNTQSTIRMSVANYESLDTLKQWSLQLFLNNNCLFFKKKKKQKGLGFSFFNLFFFC
ncbi:Ras guanine nucleotide exchange factor Q [Reticulomyxa filosa]|uniref:Ras guanine nucleotide exchange factor Q n=1 Tax=Reticulomyxa filosa TaxID=46433 RepID=X6NAF4_RETFI|nr:Ras guanine nucleotide exchange factor Q [Reticulomyxa filosa]|eukprot:ETO23001.1 Ras guanine nucleotide exchange factor Q [Reticulomyxa filosa]